MDIPEIITTVSDESCTTVGVLFPAMWSTFSFLAASLERVRDLELYELGHISQASEAAPD